MGSDEGCGTDEGGGEGEVSSSEASGDARGVEADTGVGVVEVDVMIGVLFRRLRRLIRFVLFVVAGGVPTTV